MRQWITVRRAEVELKLFQAQRAVDVGLVRVLGGHECATRHRQEGADDGLTARKGGSVSGIVARPGSKAKCKNMILALSKKNVEYMYG